MQSQIAACFLQEPQSIFKMWSYALRVPWWWRSTYFCTTDRGRHHPALRSRQPHLKTGSGSWSEQTGRRWPRTSATFITTDQPITQFFRPHKTTKPQTEGNHTAHTPLNCCGSTEDMSNWNKRLVHRQFLVLMQDTEFKDLTSVPAPNYWPFASVSMPLHHTASQRGRTLLPASGNTGEIKSSVLKHFETITWVFTETPALFSPAAPSQSIALMLQGKL